MSKPTSHIEAQASTVSSWIELHLPALLYGWFWIGMVLSGLLAPTERVAMLESGLITEGWHLSLMACCFGIPILGAYWLRMSGRWR
jgi:hypothetical protein